MTNWAKLLLHDTDGTNFSGMSTDELFAYINDGGGEYNDIGFRYEAVLHAYRTIFRDIPEQASIDPVLSAFIATAEPVVGHYENLDYTKWHPLLLRGEYDRGWKFQKYSSGYSSASDREQQEILIARMPEILEILQQHGVEPFCV